MSFILSSPDVTIRDKYPRHETIITILRSAAQVCRKVKLYIVIEIRAHIYLLRMSKNTYLLSRKGFGFITLTSNGHLQGYCTG